MYIFIFAHVAKLCFSAANGFIGNHSAFAVAAKDEILPAWWLQWWIVGISGISGTETNRQHVVTWVGWTHWQIYCVNINIVFATELTLIVYTHTHSFIYISTHTHNTKWHAGSDKSQVLSPMLYMAGISVYLHLLFRLRPINNMQCY